MLSVGVSFMSQKLVLAHFSDLHFSKVCLSPMQFFSKRWLGNWNLILKRRNLYLPNNLSTFSATLKKEGVTHLIITGDLTTTSFTEEFEAAKRYIDQLKSDGFTIYCLPGNHDCYTRKNGRESTFYNYFPDKYDPSSPYSLKTDKITTASLGNNRFLILIDTAVDTGLIWSRGLFSEVAEKNLKKLLSTLPKNCEITVATHFPILETCSPRKMLMRKEALSAIFRDDPRIKLSLNGHTHKHLLTDLREESLPLISDSGSVSYAKRASWNKITMNEGEVSFECFERKADSPEWKPFKKETFRAT